MACNRFAEMNTQAGPSFATGIKNPEESHVAPSPVVPDPVSFTREITGEFAGKSLRYRAVAGETYIRDEKGTPVASFFTVSYLKSDAEDAARPVTFAFNGGPGSSAQWLHMGALGPKCVVLPSEPVNGGAPPYSIV